MESMYLIICRMDASVALWMSCMPFVVLRTSSRVFEICPVPVRRGESRRRKEARHLYMSLALRLQSSSNSAKNDLVRLSLHPHTCREITSDMYLQPSLVQAVWCPLTRVLSDIVISSSRTWKISPGMLCAMNTSWCFSRSEGTTIVMTRHPSSS